MSREPLTRRERTGIAATACVALLSVGGAFWYGEYNSAPPPRAVAATQSDKSDKSDQSDRSDRSDSIARSQSRPRLSSKKKSKSQQKSPPRRHLQDRIPSE